MDAMRHLLRSAAVGALLVGGLAACDGGGGGGEIIVTPPPVTPPTPPSRLEDQFGANFGTTFRAANNTDPRDPQSGDLNAVSFTTDPIPVP